MSPMIEQGAELDINIRYRFVSDGRKIAIAPYSLDEVDIEDNQFSHADLANKYGLKSGTDEQDKPIVASAGWIEPETSEGKTKFAFYIDSSSCKLEGNYPEQLAKLKEVRKLAADILGEDNVVVKK